MEFRGFLALLLVALAGASSSDVRPSQTEHSTETVEPFKTCQVGELFCSDGCDLLLLCLANYDTTIVKNCTETPDYSMCDSQSLQCLHPVNATCERAPEEGGFPCHATGLFPNPYDCRSYFACTSTGDHGIKQVCTGTDPAEYGYDPLFNTCSFTMRDRVCVENPIPVCTTAAQSGAQVENPNIYYICVEDPESKVLVPWLFRCNKANEVFDDVTKECLVRIPTTTMTTVTTKGGGMQKQPFNSLMFIILLTSLSTHHF